MCRCKGYPHYKKVTNVKHSRQAEIVNFPISAGESFFRIGKSSKQKINRYLFDVNYSLDCSARHYCDDLRLN